MSLNSFITKTRVLFSTIVAAVGLFFVSPVFAITFQTYSIGDSNFIQTSGSYANQEFRLTTGGVVNTITMEYTPTSTCWTGSCTVSIYRQSAGLLMGNYSKSASTTVNGRYYVTYSGSSTLASATNYFVSDNNGAGIYGKSPSSTYENASLFDRWCTAPNQISCSTEIGADMFVMMNVWPATGAPTFINFTDTPTSTCQFDNWSVSPYVTSADATTCLASHTCSMGVAMNLSGSEETYVFNVNDGGDDIFDDPTYIVNSWGMASGSVYNARAYICSKTGPDECYMGATTNPNIMAISPQWSFIVDGLDTCTTTYFSQGEINPPAFSTSTANETLIAQANQTCLTYNDSSVLGGVVYGLCKVMVALFVPSDGILDNFGNLRTMVSTKPPFGYINVFTTQIGNLSSASSTTNTTFATNTSTSAMQISSIGQISIFGIVRTAFGWFLWFIFVIYVYNRFKHFSLHG